MNKTLLILLLLTISSMVSSKVVMTRDENMFGKVNSQLQTSLNKLLILLRLNQSVFTMNDKNRLLLSMHASLKSVTERNYLIYKGVKKMCQLNVKRKPKNGLFNLEKLIQLLVDEKLTPSIDNVTSHSKRSGGGDLKITSLEIPDNSEESILFLREYLNNVEGVELTGFESPFQKIRNLYEKNIVKMKKRKELKPWRAQNISEASPPDTRRVFHGKVAKIKKYPFVASVHVMGEFVCAASIISKDMVITAATCLLIMHQNPSFLRENPQGVVVRVGSDYTERFGEIRLAKEVYVHPDYDPETLANNLAIIKLKEKLYFEKNNKKMRRIDYKKGEGQLQDNVKELLFLGWGDREPNSFSIFEPIASASLDIYNMEQCVDRYSKKYVTEKNFCAGFTNKGSGACRNDVGGPAIVNSVLVGIVSFGPPVCGTPDAPTVFTNIGHYIKWIDSIVKGVPMNTESVDIKLANRAKITTITTPKVKTKYSSKPRFRFHKESRDSATHKNFTLPKPKTNIFLKPRTEYPKAMQVLTYLLDEILDKVDDTEPSHFMDTTKENDFDSLMSEDDDSSDDEENDKEYQQTEANPSDLRSDNTSVTFPDLVSIFHEFVTYSSEPDTPTTKTNYERTPDFTFTLSPPLTVTKSKYKNKNRQIVRMDDNQKEMNRTTTPDPLMLAIHTLKEYLGLGHDTRQGPELDEIGSDLNTEKYMSTQGVEEEESSNTESDNYEYGSSDSRGLSIEVPTGVSYFPTIQLSKLRTTIPKKDTRLKSVLTSGEFEKDKTENKRPAMIQEIAERILKKNFVEKDSLPGSNDVKSDELVVLLLKQNFKRPRLKKIMRERRKRQRKSYKSNRANNKPNAEPNEERVTMAAYEIAESDRYEENEDENSDIEKENEIARRRLLDYIITN